MSNATIAMPMQELVLVDLPEEEIISAEILSAHAPRQDDSPPDVVVDSRPFRHAHIIRRPRPLQYYKPDNTITVRKPTTPSDIDGEERSTDDLLKQLNRIDLFIDLVWVGIIGNLSSSFGEQAFSDSGVSVGIAFLEFLLLFIPIWRVWDHLRAFGSNFYNDGVFQRQFMCWILVLAVIYGINAPYAFNPQGGPNSLSLLIVTYLITRVSFLVAHGYQCIYMHFLLHQFLALLFTTIVTAGLWVPAIWVPYPGKVALLVTANLIEQPFDVLMASPLGDRLVTGGWKRRIDIEHYVERYEGFFIIILGEGVFQLVDGSPSGLGLNSTTGTVLTVLLLFYLIHWLYFNGDQSKEYVHALRRTWWKPVLWQMAHVTMFGALLILAAATLFLVKHRDEKYISLLVRSAIIDAEGKLSDEDSYSILYALWSGSIALTVVIFSMTEIAILHRSLDKPDTLVINSRWLRLAPRLPAVVVIVCLPLFKGITGSAWCGAVVVILYVLFIWEWIAGLENNWKFVEQKEE